ncbi:1,5-anhydro-D-fructose reductase isoform X2 [Scaptodrosophila lebanonensis]|uniref:1,5-anhydro-D-fructose reductase isoform X2 n=1 Tax=Drosophila lebanonensis TaxID=7225 RepID=A0A6J2UE57_DROLE|nr:1,5-anhydro-D-fructose reductase isoform X2 [Scaptodrosophila lebanonensis]
MFYRSAHLSVIFQQLVKRSALFCPKISGNMSSKTQLKLAPTVKLNNGYEMPVLGLGTYELKKTKCENAVRCALDLGYRHIDTAYLYGNEAIIGKVLEETIASGIIKRDEIFLVTKLWDIYHEPTRVRYACELQLQQLGVIYIDLYLMHSPVGVKYVNDDELMPHSEGVLQTNDVDFVDTYRAMEELVDLGLVRSLGVSNFNSAQLERLLQDCRIKPVTNQIECHLQLIQWPLIEFCRAHEIVVTAYSPLGRPKPSKPLPSYYNDSELLAMAKNHRKTIAQLVLRYLLDIGTVPIPKAAQIQHLRENFDLFDFSLTAQEMELFENFNERTRLWKFEKAKGHQHYPH